MAGIFHGFNILIQRPLARLEWRSGPVLPAAFELVFCYAQVDGIFDRVHRDCISIVNKCNKAAYLCFRDNVANYEPMGALQKQGRRNAQSGKLEFQGRVEDAHPPLNLPSVTQATSWPSPAPIIKLVGFSISGMPDFHSFFPVNIDTLRFSNDVPGPPFGPRYRRTMTVFSPFLIDPTSTACTNSSSESNTRAFPVNPRPSFPVIFAIAPPGARLPVSTLTGGVTFRMKQEGIDHLART